ncbi:hypothetical protein GCM10010251_52420 [Streptomyces aurantiogriseus]|uniref:Uncharacterized protein n=2 Tax=Streptomyces aurantiogriseus TaxID=66870 RepID=A0A918FDH2_9ACTN|nr:hypothetical protein GCM10010251_52420 [Streptomyces aurantiogriseus]
MDHRELDVGPLSRQAEAEESELWAVLRGAAPDPVLLRKLAPALGWRTADLFAVAGIPVPEELAPLDATAGRLVPQLVRHAVALPQERRGALLRHVRSLPQENRTMPVRAPRPHEQYRPGFGAALLHMLANRNLDWTGSARVLCLVSGLYVSAATIGGVGHGRVELTRDLLADFAVVLGIPVGDLTALAGPVGETDVLLGERLRRQHSAGPDVAELIVELARLSCEQIRQIGVEAGAEVR